MKYEEKALARSGQSLSRTLILILIPVLTVICSASVTGTHEKIIVARIRYFYDLKSLADRYTWKGFDDPGHELPLIYYTDKNCYVTNPTQKFLAIYKPPLIYKKGRVSIYKTGLLDSAAFHMETFMSMEDTAAYDYKSMFMRCSSLEMTKRNPKAELLDVEQWSALVLHEYFHGFQFTHPGFAVYYRDSMMSVSGETFKRLYDDNPGLKESIDKENDLLLKALETDTKKEAVALLDSFFMIKTSRQNMVKQAAGFDLGKYEEFYETMEGTARYIEYGLSNIFKTKKPDKNLAKSDPAYHSYAFFRTFKLQDAPEMYLTSKTNYVYASGFNMARMADKLNIPYKNRLFIEPRLTLGQILREFVRDTKGK